MPKNVKDTMSTWIDPDDAPAWTDETFERAEVRRGDKVIKAASGTVTRRGRPRLAIPKKQVTLRLDQAVVDKLRAGGDGWQSRVNEILRKAVGA